MTASDRNSKTPAGCPQPTPPPKTDSPQPDEGADRVHPKKVRFVDRTAEWQGTGISIIGGRYSGTPTPTTAPKKSEED